MPSKNNQNQLVVVGDTLMLDELVWYVNSSQEYPLWPIGQKPDKNVMMDTNYRVYSFTGSVNSQHLTWYSVKFPKMLPLTLFSTNQEDNLSYMREVLGEQQLDHEVIGDSKQL